MTVLREICWFDWSVQKFPEDLGRAVELAVATLQAVLKRTVGDWAAAGVNPPIAQLELRLIQSREDILHPTVTVKVEPLVA